MTSQKPLKYYDEATHTVFVNRGGNIHSCLKSLKSIRNESDKFYDVVFGIQGGYDQGLFS